MNLFSFFDAAASFLLGWPLIIYVITIALICTVALSFVQLRYFVRSWKLTLSPPTLDSTTKIEMTPLQAFVNTLNTSLGNGSIAGMATAIYSGGPGAALWVLVIGFLTMSIRYSEIFLSTFFKTKTGGKDAIGGPMLYLKNIAGGKYLSWLYAFFCLIFGLIVGCAMQTNSVRLSAVTTWGFHQLTIAALITIFIIYVVVGGAPRIVKISNKVVPLKILLFFGSAFIILIYHSSAIPSALQLIIKSAFSPTAALGGALGFTIQQAIRYGMIRNINATESGLGTAAIFFGATGSKKPIESGIMSMAITFISTLVGFLICLCIIASGAWKTGLTSTALTIAAYNTVFGAFGGWMVSFLSITFGIGVIVGYVYLTKKCWLFITNGKFGRVFDVLFCLVGFWGAISDVNMVWAIGDVINASMLSINLFGIIYLLPLIKRKLSEFRKIN